MDKKPQLIAKENEVQMLADNFANSEAVIIADYRGLTVSEVTALRNELRKAGVTYKVAKNTLIKRAANDNSITCLDSFLEGPTAIAFSADPVTLAKTMYDFSKAHSNLELKAGVVEGDLMEVADLEKLAKIPSREVLLAKFIGSLRSPLYGFAYIMDQLAKREAPAAEEAVVEEAPAVAEEA